MRSLFLILLLANLLVFAARFDVVRGLVGDTAATRRPPPLNAERLRIVRDTSRTTTVEPSPPAAN